MKTKTLLAMGLCAAIGLTGLTTSAVAAEKDHDKEHKHEHEKAAPKKKGELKIPDTAEGILKEIHEYHENLTETIKHKKLDDVHHLAFAIRDLAKALPAKAPAAKKKKVEGAVKNIAKIAEKLDESGDAGDQRKTESNLKKMDGMLKMLASQFKHTHKH